PDRLAGGGADHRQQVDVALGPQAAIDGRTEQIEGLQRAAQVAIEDRAGARQLGNDLAGDGWHGAVWYGFRPVYHRPAAGARPAASLRHSPPGRRSEERR